MRAGRLRSYIVIERPVYGAQNAAGEPEVAWQVFARGWAAQEAPTSRAMAAAAQRWADVRMVVRMRYVDGIEPGMRATIGDRRYLIADAADPDGYLREVLITLRDLR
jgi:head-tail adaptor